jgi:DNA repair protein RadA/Sms
LREARQLGFRRVVVPKSLRRRAEAWPDGLEVVQARSVREALEAVLMAGQRPRAPRGKPGTAEAAEDME